MKKIVQIAWEMRFKLLRTYGSWLLKCQSRHMLAVFLKAYIQTFSLFPDNKLKHNVEIASFVQSRLLGIPLGGDSSVLDEGQVRALYDVVKSDKWVQKTLSNFFLVQAFHFGYGTSDMLREESDNALKKAKAYVDKALPLSHNDVGPIYKKIKSDIKLLRKKIWTLNSQRIEIEKLKIIKPVTVTSSHVIFIASLFSTLFLISGFAYNKLFFGSFGINVSDFFVISDYIASSVDIIAATIISSAIGIAFSFWGYIRGLSERLRAEQFEYEIKGEDYVLPIVVVTLAFGLVSKAYQTGELFSIFLYPLVLIVSLYIYYKLPIWKYIENKMAVGAVLMSVLYFTIHLGLNINENLKDIKSGHYESPYVITFRKEYKKYSKHSFVAGNSNYIFLWDGDNGKIIVVPKNGVESFNSIK